MNVLHQAGLAPRAGTGAASPTRDPEDDDDLDPLPPLDGSDDEPDPHVPPDDLDDVSEDPTDLLDDSTGFTGAPGDADGDELAAEGDREEGWLEDATDAEELDVGPDDLDVELVHERAGLLEDADEPGVGDEDFGLHEAPSTGEIDAGEEGFDADDEELREEDLPRLDADEGGELEDEDFTDPWPTDDDRPAWDDRAWERATELPRVGMARAVLPIEGGAIVAGAMLLRVEATGATPLEGGREIHGGAILGAARLAGETVLCTERGGVLVVPDAGVAREANGWKALAPGGAAAEVAADGHQRVWVRTRAGALAASDDRGATWRLVAPAGVEALAESGGEALVVVAAEGGGRVVARGEDPAKWGGNALPSAPSGASWRVCARGDVVCAAALGAGVFRAKGGGAWTRFEGTSNVTALALVDDAGTALVALHSASEDRAWIARAGADGIARIVAEIGGDPDERDDPRVLALAWDDREQIAWAAGPFGLAVLRAR